MSATRYQIFCRYFQASSNRAVTNETTVEWVQAEQTHGHTDTNSQQPPVTMDTKSIEGYENMYIRHEDRSCVAHKQGYADRDQERAGKKRAEENKKICQKIDTQLSMIVSKESRSSNPKYDMMFVYDGLTECLSADIVKSTKYGDTDNIIEDPTDYRSAAHVYYERMKRIDGPAPWFEYATCASLTVAMRKAEELVNIMGKENVIIGKVVNLKEYIDIE